MNERVHKTLPCTRKGPSTRGFTSRDVLRPSVDGAYYGQRDSPMRINPLVVYLDISLIMLPSADPVHDLRAVSTEHESLPHY